ncbi:MAG TPA: aldo/keto reductase, partial [Geminicoccaceae bacterium]|nr:aldo/keto reductase [Geminicoccaceae bacterium]
MASDVLPKRRLGRTRLELTELGFGAGPLGNFYGAVAPSTAAATVEAAWQAGVRTFDTAPLYGYGRSELRLGHVLRELPRDEFVLCSKVGRYFVPLKPGDDTSRLRPGGLPFRPVLDYSYDGALRSLEHSLLRLGVARLDVVHLHDLDAWACGGEEMAEKYLRQAETGAFKALSQLRASGDIGAIGVGVNQPAWAARIVRALDLDCVMIAGRYSLLNQEALDELFPLCIERKVGVLAAGPFNGGLLVRGPAPGVRYNYAEPPAEIVERLDRLQAVCERHAVPIAAAALQFTAAHPAVTSVVAGAMSPDEVGANVGHLRQPIPGSFWQDLRRSA